MTRAPRISAAARLAGAAILTVVASAESLGAERYDADLASSRVRIEGTSTLHDWHLEGRHVGGYLLVPEHELASLWTNSGPSLHELAPTVQVEIPVTSLMSGKRGMDETMREALKATRYPVITYRLESATVTMHQPTQAEDAGGSFAIETTGVLTVAGVDRTMDIPMRVRRLSDRRVEVSGDTSLRMTEFGIKPPRAMLGTLRTGDEVHLHWTWVLVQGLIDHRDER